MSKGSGWGEFRQGERVTDLRTLKVGDILLCESLQFDAKNIVKILQTEFEFGDPGEKVHAAFVNPKDTNKGRIYSNGTFCIWDFFIGDDGTLRLFRILEDKESHVAN